MDRRWIKRGIGLSVVAAVIAAAVYALMPQPVGVDIAVIDHGPLEVTVDEEGVARIRDIFRVSTPVAGRVERLPVRSGDRVEGGRTTVALIRPADPPFLDLRTRREVEAAAEAARAAVVLADEQRAGAEARFNLARARHQRAEQLIVNGRISESAYEEAAAARSTAEAELRQAEANLALRRSELDAAEARLIGPEGGAIGSDPDSDCVTVIVPRSSAEAELRQAEARLSGPDGGTAAPGTDSGCVTVTAPSDGVVLSVLSESEQVLPAGAALVEIGDPANIEIVAHLLSSDAVKVASGMAARLDDWGGGSLAARVARVSPAAYTKVSALGIEEQRVDVVLDLVDPREAWERLGHEFRVMVHIPVWSAEDALRVPVGALFRRGSQWMVFRVVGGRASLSPVEIGERNNRWAEVLDGLAAGDQVVLHPSDRVAEGVAVEAY